MQVLRVLASCMHEPVRDQVALSYDDPVVHSRNYFAHRPGPSSAQHYYWKGSPLPAGPAGDPKPVPAETDVASLVSRSPTLAFNIPHHCNWKQNFRDTARARHPTHCKLCPAWPAGSCPCTASLDQADGQHLWCSARSGSPFGNSRNMRRHRQLARLKSHRCSTIDGELQRLDHHCQDT